MADQHRMAPAVDQFREGIEDAIMADEEGVDGEIDEIGDFDRGVSGKDSKDSRKRSSGSERRRHHRHHHSSSHRERRRRSGGANDAEGEQYMSEDDGRVGSGHSKRRSESQGLPNADGSEKTTRSSHRRSDRSHGSHSRTYKDQQQNMDDSYENGELLDSHEDPLAYTRYSSTLKRNAKDKKDEHGSACTGLTEEGEAEDGEILEEGELSDDDVVEIKDGENVGRDVEATPTKVSSKGDGKAEKHKRKKSEHKSKKHRDSDDKARRKKYADVDKMDAENSPAPAWGSGYQGPKPKSSSFHSKQSQQYGRGGRGYHSPPGLYDSPSYSEDSGEEALSKNLMTEGYIDASVAADEKEGIFNPKLSLGKKKQIPLERNDRKRVRTFEGKPEGPPRKKLLSQAMSERPVCKFYMEGKCAKGNACHFNHDVEKPRRMEVCKYHLTVKGCIKQRCLYMHHFPCKYYHTGAKCYSGDRCKFSHDPLTEETRRALEMRVAAEDIIDVEEMEYDYRTKESHSKPSLLGSPPRFRQEVKKIPSLFEIEVHPPGQSPKPSPQAPSRPSGFYNETTTSPKPGVGVNPPGPGNSTNVGVMNNSAPGSQGLPNQGNSVLPNQGNIPPGQGNMMPNQGNIPPGQGNMMPNQGKIPPGQGNMMPNQGNMMPNQGNMMPNQGNILPNQGNMMPNQGNILPNQGNMVPNQGNMVPNQGNMMPNQGNMMPNQGNMMPNQGNMMPNQGNMMPNHGNMLPNQANMVPNQCNLGGPGLLQTPLRPPNLVGGPMPNNRPNLIIGMNPQQQRPSGGAPIQFLGPRQVNSNQQGANLPPVLNMLGAIIREAALHKGPGGNSSNINMGPNSGMAPANALQNLGPGLNVLNPGSMQQGNMNIGPNNVGSMALPGSQGNMQSGNINNMGPMQNIVGPSSNIGNVAANSLKGNAGSNNNNTGLNDSLDLSATASNTVGGRQNIGIGQEVGIMDVDYRIKPDFIEIEDTNKELSELDKIRQQIQAQIDKEDEEGQEVESDDKVQDSDEMEKSNEEHPLTMTDEVPVDRDDVRDDKAAMKADVPGDSQHIEFPADLPKTQRELFKRIQQQQILREKERKKQEAFKVTEESDTKAEDDDWYSSDDDADEMEKPNLTDILKRLNQPLTTSATGTSSTVSDSCTSSSSGISATSTFNIMQMINAIKNQTPAKPAIDSAAAANSNKFSPPQSSQQVFLSSPASPPLVSMSLTSLRLPELTVDPPVVSAQPNKPLVYSVVKILLNIPKPYTQLPDSICASDQAFRDDPRVKWHLNYLEKLGSKAPQKKENSDGEKSQKQSDPRLKKGPSDPRLSKSSEGPNSSKATDPRLQRASGQTRPADPRLARQNIGNLDPRLSRQNSQNSPDGVFLGGALNTMGGSPINTMGGGPMNAMGVGPMNAMGGIMNGQMGGSGNGMGVLMSSPGGSVNQIGGPMSNLMHNLGSMASTDNQLNMMNPMNNQVGGPGRPFLGGGGSVNNAMGIIGGPGNNLAVAMNSNGGPFNPMGPGAHPVIRGPHGPGVSLVGMGNVGSTDSHMGSMRGPFNQQNPGNTDPGMLDPRMNSSSGARPSNQRPVNELLGGNDPRLKNRFMDPREQRTFVKDPRSGVRDVVSGPSGSPSRDEVSDSGMVHPHGDYRSLQNNARVLDDIRQSPGYLQGDVPSFGNSEHFKILQGREEWSHNSDHRVEHDDSLQVPSSSSSVSSSAQYLDMDKPAPKFDHRNDPRFKRVKRLPGQIKSNMEYSSPLSGEDSQGDINEGADPGYNSFFHSRLSSRDPRHRATSSPSLPDTLQDFDLPNSSPVTAPESELDLKVKDHFKTIDPTASPFC